VLDYEARRDMRLTQQDTRTRLSAEGKLQMQIPAAATFPKTALG
jgi:hypothetical protein